MEYIISLLFLILSIVFILKNKIFNTNTIPRKAFVIAFFFKLLMAVAMLFIYSRSENIKKNADIFRFYNDAKVISETIYHQPTSFFKIITTIDDKNEVLDPYYEKMNNWENKHTSQLLSNNRLLIRYLAIGNVISFGSYGGLLVITCLLSFIGLFWIYKFINSQLENKSWIIFLLIFFFPSIAFWSSGLLKESLLIFAIGLLINQIQNILKSHKIILGIILTLMSFYIIFEIKAFVALVLFPCILGFFINKIFIKTRPVIVYVAIILISFSVASNIQSKKLNTKNIYELLVIKQLQFIDLGIKETGNSIISPINFQATPISILTNSPIALVNSLFRPMFWEVKNTIMLFSATENGIILILLLLIIAFPNSKLENPNLFWFCLSFSIIYFIIIGLTCPIMGAVSRYRIPALIFFLLAILQLIDLNCMKKLFQKIANKFNKKCC